MGAILLFTTTPTLDDAKKISKELIEKKLAACVSIISGLESLFYWEGKLTEEKEYLLMVKTREELSDYLIDCVKKLHPYRVPEIIASKILFGNPEYLEWLEETTKLGKG